MAHFPEQRLVIEPIRKSAPNLFPPFPYFILQADLASPQSLGLRSIECVKRNCNAVKITYFSEVFDGF